MGYGAADPFIFADTNLGEAELYAIKESVDEWEADECGGGTVTTSAVDFEPIRKNIMDLLGKKEFAENIDRSNVLEILEKLDDDKMIYIERISKPTIYINKTDFMFYMEFAIKEYVPYEIFKYCEKDVMKTIELLFE